MSTLKFMAHQGLALRGDGFGELDSNFLQVLNLTAVNELDGKFAKWIERKRSNYTGHETQNEILKVMAMQVLKHITSNLQSCNFTIIMVDETTDVSTTEQVVLIFRWVDNLLQVPKIL